MLRGNSKCGSYGCLGGLTWLTAGLLPTCAKPPWCESLSQHQSGAVLPYCSTRVEVYSHVYAILSWLSMSFRRMSIACRYAPLQATSGDDGKQDHLPHQDRESFSDSIADDREDFSSDSAPLIGGRPCSPINSVSSVSGGHSIYPTFSPQAQRTPTGSDGRLLCPKFFIFSL